MLNILILERIIEDYGEYYSVMFVILFNYNVNNVIILIILILIMIKS